MKQKVDLIVHSARQLLTLGEVEVPSALSISPSCPRRGEAMNELGLIEDGAVAVSRGLVTLVGTTEEVLAQTEAEEMIDASNRVVMPGFVDPHTHLVFAGSREDEFESRLRGTTYMEIMAAGGGIMSTVRATRVATLPQLIAQSRGRLDRMLAHGTTTAEAKSGYGLNVDDELKMLEAIRQLDATHPVDLVPTFLGAHAVPVEFKGRADEYVEVVINEMLPLTERELRENASGASAPSVPFFCDVFCEEGVFSVSQSRRILERARELGFGLKVHADEFEPLGGTSLAVELGAVSADHLVCTPVDEIEALAGSDTIAVSLPGTPFGLGHHEYTPARQIIEAGGALALATDLNPGTCYCESMQIIIALACRYMRLTPAEAIAATTLNAAHALGLGDRVGSLETGKKADILVLDIPNYRHLGYHFGVNLVERVIKSGQVLYRNSGK
ncbi:MAG: imidazolonepropionase [Anaerolineales bacterium]|nr:MAG: imidazolonepropionase [Anaerolineales bacterium]